MNGEPEENMSCGVHVRARTSSSTRPPGTYNGNTRSSLAAGGPQGDRPSVYSYHRYPNPIPRIERGQIQLRGAIDSRQRVYRAVVTEACAVGPVGTTIVVKKIECLPQQRFGSEPPGLETEASLMRQVAHPNVVRLLGVCPADPTTSLDRAVWLVTPVGPFATIRQTASQLLWCSL